LDTETEITPESEIEAMMDRSRTLEQAQDEQRSAIVLLPTQKTEVDLLRKENNELKIRIKALTERAGPPHIE
jgi:hypothetical protein